MTRSYNKKRLNKRWYIDATIGKNVPIIGGSGFKAGTGTLTKRSLDTHIKKVVKRSVLEPKLYRSGLLTASGVNHNAIYTHNLLSGIVQGDDEENRTGDSIGIKSCRINMQYFGLGTGLINTQHVRVMVVKSKVANATTGIISAALGTTDIFWDSPAELMTAMVCYNQCSVLMDKTFKLNPTFSGQRTDFVTSFNVDLPSTFKYSEANGALGKFYNYYLVVIPYQSRAQPTDAIGDFIINTAISFVDSK